jgi:hypothetical protein
MLKYWNCHSEKSLEWLWSRDDAFMWQVLWSQKMRLKATYNPAKTESKNSVPFKSYCENGEGVCI